MLTKSTLKMATLGVALVSVATAINADDAADYPTKTIQFLVAAGAGGGTDNFARVVRPMFEEALGGANITVINLPSASGALAHQRTATGAADGHTLDFASTTLVTSLAAGQNPIGLDQLTPVARMQSDVMALFVNPERYPDFESFLEYAKENPGEVTVGGTHTASPDHVSFLSLRDASGLDMNFIPYDSTGNATANVLGNNIDATTTSLSPLLSYMEAGQMMPILVFSDERLADYPDVPTTAEYEWDLTDGNDRAIFVHADTPEPLLKRLEDTFKKVYDSEEYQTYAERVNLTYREGWMGSAEYRQRLENNYELYSRLLNNDQ
ncbi:MULTISPECIES: Bug family tripartite tricarboxylate transporter substrate binding protein [unclassified Halomonas]|uniref:Bug family tripartite tricarboxylate transporter substrate binding protein n=1 Tax=unclassified Halomonas TaxID=2609666 RepID=UPI001CF1D12F|nr:MULTISPECIES: tripartite tricarboxylate transporter substrate binding protein [unclassified Halomonas]MCA8862923.1 tripartite tricarboxylate transporter substrate binding protein [Halomonas sp. SBBP1]UZH09572.1 tripartite tricarboxylate transporter substrate binding protein [Halomonas sp. BDJS001]